MLPLGKEGRQMKRQAELKLNSVLPTAHDLQRNPCQKSLPGWAQLQRQENPTGKQIQAHGGGGSL